MSEGESKEAVVVWTVYGKGMGEGSRSVGGWVFVCLFVCCSCVCTCYVALSLSEVSWCAECNTMYYQQYIPSAHIQYSTVSEGRHGSRSRP